MAVALLAINVMRRTRWILCGALLIASWPANGQGPAADDYARPAPVSRQRRYVMNARVRPLLFWIRRNDVGEGRITWREAPDGAFGYELLVGSDPAKAPRRINKWGYIAEFVSGSSARIVGVMKQARAESAKEAEEQLAREGQGGFAFQTIHASVSGDRLTARTAHLSTPTDLTLRDLDSLLVLSAGADARPRTYTIPTSTAPGFLSAVAALVRETALQPAARANGGAPSLPAARAYIYNGRLYDLRLRAIDATQDFAAASRRYGPALDAEFEITNRTTRKTTKFWMVYGRRGEDAGVPFKIVFRPKWWFEAELLLER